jgi:predicted DNA-binding WGR domain protein
MFYYLVNTNNGHNKFYTIYLYAFTDKETSKDNSIYVSLQWGKIGTRGQAQHKEFKSRGEAITFAEDKVREKLKKGYEFKETEELREIADIPKANEELIG